MKYDIERLIMIQWSLFSFHLNILSLFVLLPTPSNAVQTAVDQFEKLPGDSETINKANEIVHQLRAQLMTGNSGKVPVFMNVGTCRCRNKVLATLFSIDSATNTGGADFKVISQISFKYTSGGSHTGLFIESNSKLYVLDALKGFITPSAWIGDKAIDYVYVRGTWIENAQPGGPATIQFDSMAELIEHKKNYGFTLAKGRLVEDRSKVEFVRSFMHMQEFRDKVRELQANSTLDKDAKKNQLIDFNKSAGDKYRYDAEGLKVTLKTAADSLVDLDKSYFDGITKSC